MDQNLWLIELESALLDDCNVNEIYSICKGRPLPEPLRPDVWQVCLNVRHMNDQMSLFNEIYDLPFQNILREDCQKVVERIGNDDEDKVSVLSDLESILTFYCKIRNLKYESDNGWIELLLPLLALKLNRSDTYNLFEAIRDMYVPKGCKPKGNVFHVFRLLILYHDPELCTMLDTKKITSDLYSMSWFKSLFASSCSLQVILSMWDLYFQYGDPFLVFFLGLIILVNCRDQILSMKDSSKEEIVEFLSNMLGALETDDVSDFFNLAKFYAMSTPSSFKTDFLKALYGKQSENNNELQEDTSSSIISQALCLPVSVYELTENASLENYSPKLVRFFLIDCRPAEQYNAGHLPTAFHLDTNLMLQEPEAYATAVQGLLKAQGHSIEANSQAGGEHLCFMGSGRVEEDQYTHMVVASFLQKNTQYVSLLTGGYTAIHDYFSERRSDCIEDHDSRTCIVCYNQRNSITNITSLQNKSKDSQKMPNYLFSKFSAAMKSKSAEVKEKLLDIVTPTLSSTSLTGTYQHATSASTIQERHVSSLERNGKRYRNVAPVFSIDDDNDDIYDNVDSKHSSGQTSTKLSGDSKDIVNLTQFLKSPDIINAFKCQEVHMNGYMYDSHLIINPTHLVVLRELGKGQAQIIVKRPLANIVKITAKKRHKDLITFKYGCPDGDGLLITDMDRFLIPNASEATAIVSKHIVQTLNGPKIS